MRIGILGAGAMANALGGRFVQLGHEVLVGARSPARAAATASSIGAACGTMSDAAAFGDIILLAVHYVGVHDTLEQAGAVAGLRSKIVIDCTNPVELENFTVVTPDGSSVAERVAAATGARVVKAFNMCHASVWSMTPDEMSRGRASVLYATDDDAAGQQTAALISELGYAPLSVGGLVRARQLESAAAMVIYLLMHGQPPGSVLNWVNLRAPTGADAGAGGGAGSGPGVGAGVTA